MRTISIAFLAIACFALSACVSPGGAGGLLYNNYTGPYQALGNASGKKVGESSVTCYIGLVCLGDAGIAAAAEDGGITKISNVDYRYKSYVGFIYTKTTIIVTGE